MNGANPYCADASFVPLKNLCDALRHKPTLGRRGVHDQKYAVDLVSNYRKQTDWVSLDDETGALISSAPLKYESYEYPSRVYHQSTRERAKHSKKQWGTPRSSGDSILALDIA